jgi:outer membrane protein OmpA-like peptidoglycan-associated protein
VPVPALCSDWPTEAGAAPSYSPRPRAAVGARGSCIWSGQTAKQKQQMETATRGTGVQVTQTAGNRLKLEVPSDFSFATNSAQLAPGRGPGLDRFAQTLIENPRTTVRSVGHTDTSGSDAINDPWSVNRASSVRNHLVSHGAAADRSAIERRGSREPIADHQTEAGRAPNRRSISTPANARPDRRGLRRCCRGSTAWRTSSGCKRPSVRRASPAAAAASRPRSRPIVS